VRTGFPFGERARAAIWPGRLRLGRVRRQILTERWNQETGRRIGPENPAVLAERSRIRRTGFFT